jgi:predicted Fe-Mo cluster-binding NifX family protein
MIAIPIASDHATTLFPAFGNASFFATLDPVDGYFNIIDGFEYATLEELIKALKAEGVDAAVIPDAEEEPLDTFRKEGISVYSVPESISSIDDVFEAYTRRELLPVA